MLRKIRLSHVCAALGLLLGGVGMFLLVADDGKWRRAIPGPAGEDGVLDNAGLAVASNAAEPSTPLPASGPLANAGDPERQVPHTTVDVVLRQNGVACGGLHLKAGVVDRALLHAGEPHGWTASDLPMAATASLKTDEAGTVRMVVPRWYAIVLRIESPGFTWEGGGVFRTVVPQAAAAATHVLAVAEGAPFAIDVTFEDGAPFEGKVFVSGLRSGKWIEVLYDGVVAGSIRDLGVFAVPLRATVISLYCTGRRPGYLDSVDATFEADRFPRGGLLRCVVGRSDRKAGSIVVDAARVATPTSLRVVVVDQQGSVCDAGSVNAGAAYRTTLLPFGTWRVFLVGQDYAHVFPDVAIDREDTRILFAPPSAASGSIRVLVADESGAMIGGAAITLNTHAYLNWRHRAHFGRGELADTAMALGGDDGAVVLRSAPAGAYEVMIEAEGYEPIRRLVEVRPGSELNLGQVSLVPAVGVIFVAVDGVKQGQRYRLYLFQPGGSVLQTRDVEDAKLEFRGLPFRKYVVAVAVVPEGKPASTTVELTADTPTANVKLNVP